MADVYRIPTISAPVAQPQAAGSALIGAVAVSSGVADAGKVLLLDSTGQIDPSFISGGGSQLYVNTVPVSSPNFQSSATVAFAVLGSNITATAASGSAFQVNGSPVSSSATINFENGTDITVSNPSAGNVQFAFNGTLPQNTPAVLHEFVTAYNSATGVFTQAQPAYGDISGTPNLSVYALLSGATFTGTVSAPTLVSTTNLHVGGTLEDGSSSVGTIGQVLTSTVTGVQWATFSSTPSFSAITTGTNITATMTVGSGASLAFSGTGVVNANELYGVTINSTAPGTGQVLTATSSSAAAWQTPAGSLFAFQPAIVPPAPVTSWTKYDVGSTGTFTDLAEAVMVSTSAGDAWKFLYTAVPGPSGTAFTLTAAFFANIYPNNAGNLNGYPQACLFVQGASGFRPFGAISGSNPSSSALNAAPLGTWVGGWSSFTSQALDAVPPVAYPVPQPMWCRIRYDGTNLSFWLAQNGVDWIEAYTEVSSSGVLAGAPQQIGFGVNNYSSPKPAIITLVHWSVTTP
jgi:hypothetical protein